MKNKFKIPPFILSLFVLIPFITNGQSFNHVFHPGFYGSVTNLYQDSEGIFYIESINKNISGWANESFWLTNDGTPSLEKEDIKPLATAPALSNIAHGFTFRSASFEGNTAISGTILQSLMGPYIGKKIDKDFAERLSDYPTGYYRQEGYFLSVVYLDDINPATGILSFFVVEGYVGRITLKKDNVDSTSDWQGLIAKYMDKIAAMKPLHGPTWNAICC